MYIWNFKLYTIIYGTLLGLVKVEEYMYLDDLYFITFSLL